MRLFGLIGYPLSHSFSQNYFEEKFRKEKITDCYYHTFPIKKLNHLPELIKMNPELLGLNVTIPYKEEVIKYLDYIDPEAKIIGAVNTIKVEKKNNKINLSGYNTDYYGFYEFINTKVKSPYPKALILGTGGAAKAVGFALKKLRMDHLFVSRKPTLENQISYKEIVSEIVQSYQLIINATPVGMFPEVSSFPAFPFGYISRDHLIIDLIYNPAETIFLKRAKEKGAQVFNGLEMLHLQAERSWEIWNNPES